MSILKLFLAFFSLSLAVQGICHSNSNFTELPCHADVRDVNTTRAQTQLFTISRIATTDVTASVYSEKNSAHASLFGPIREMRATVSEMKYYKHPRILFGPSQWNDLLSMYADPKNFDKDGTWSKFFRSVSQNLGPRSNFILELAELERNGSTSAYYGRPFSTSASYKTYRNGLKELASYINMGSAGNADSFPLCALWGSVALKQQAMGDTPFLDPQITIQTCVKAAVAWSKIVLAHRTYYCNPTCPKYGENLSGFWNTERLYSLDYNWFLGGTGIAFAYDLLYDHISKDDRTLMRSALAMFVMKRSSWGSTETSTRNSPNAEDDPHRIFSNWAGYNSNLYLANLAIEGEVGFDMYTTAVLAENKASGFNLGLHTRYSALLEAFMLHSFYPDGSSFEDGYSYFTALREGSLGLLASHRRGSNVLGSPRFRNIIQNAAQMHEPWHCGKLMGHASGGGIVYNAYVALFRYVFPQGELPGMLWRQRFGEYKNNAPCRILWAQSILQLSFLGGEHSSIAESPEFLDAEHRKHFSLSYYAPRRGLLIARSSLSEKSAYMHFDARPDAFFLGHDNADRGVFTFTALRQTWLDDLEWRGNRDSRKHSLMHVDGLAQDMKAPSARMLKVKDDGETVIAAADLTYTYNVQWARDHNYNFPPTREVTTYNQYGVPVGIQTTFRQKENLSPWALGWPQDDTAEDIGFTKNMSLNGVENVGFMGLWIWKKGYREENLRHMVRSSVLVRSDKNDIGYGIVVDSVGAGAGSHSFESYLVLNPSVVLVKSLSWCMGNRCKLVLSTGGVVKVDIHVIAKGYNLSYRLEVFDGTNQRVIVKSERFWNEEIWVVLHPHEGTPNRLSVKRSSEGHCTVSYLGDDMTFALDSINHVVRRVKKEPPANSQSSPSASPSPLTGPPMPPMLLRWKTTVDEASMKSESKHFFHDTDARYQMVFQVRGKSSGAHGLQDAFVTCSANTTVATRLSLYDCGEGAVAQSNYAARRCLRVGMSGAADSCRRFRTRFKTQLVNRKTYFLVSSIYPGKASPALTIRHGRSPI